MQFTRRVFKSICAIMLIVIVVLLIPPLATQILNAIILPRNLFLTIHGSKCWRSCFMGTSLNTCTFAGKQTHFPHKHTQESISIWNFIQYYLYFFQLSLYFQIKFHRKSPHGKKATLC